MESPNVTWLGEDFPVFWEEVPSLRGNAFDARNILARLANEPSDPWEGFHEAARTLTRAMRTKVGL